MAATTNQLSIVYNLMTMEIINSNSLHVFTAGHYLCFHLAPSNEVPETLMFLDLKKHPDLIPEVLDDVDQQLFKQR